MSQQPQPLPDLGTYRRLSQTYGWFDTLALTASYNFSHQEMRAATAKSTGERDQLYRTILHETCHLYQMLSTSYGMYYYTLRGLQSDLIRTIVMSLTRNYQLDIHLPLIDMYESLRPKERYQDIRFMIQAWTATELMLIYLEGNYDLYAYLLQENSLLQTRPMTDYFNILENFVVAFLNATGRPCPPVANGLQMNETSILGELQYLGFKGTETPDTRGIFETWSTIAEFWFFQNDPLDKHPEIFPSSTQLGEYYLFLHWARDGIAAKTVGEFMFSYMALCEIALSAPLLPYHQNLRPRNADFNHMNPMRRFMTLTSAVSGIRPIHNLETDYTRFVQDVCGKLGWATPMDQAQITVKDFQYLPYDRLSAAYAAAQRYRLSHPSIFCDMGMWFPPQRPYTADFMDWFTHPVILYTDTQLHHANRDVVVFFTMQNLMNNYLRRLLISDTQEVTFPYPSSAEERSMYQELMQTQLEAMFGFRPKVVLVPQKS